MAGGGKSSKNTTCFPGWVQVRAKEKQSHLSEARQGAGRRRDLMALEERSRREAEAHFAAYVRGRGRRNIV